MYMQKISFNFSFHIDLMKKSVNLRFYFICTFLAVQKFFGKYANLLQILDVPQL